MVDSANFNPVEAPASDAVEELDPTKFFHANRALMVALDEVELAAVRLLRLVNDLRRTLR